MAKTSFFMIRLTISWQFARASITLGVEFDHRKISPNMTHASTPVDYLGLGRQLAGLLGSSLEGASADALKELARAYDPSATEARISAEVFIFHKYLVVQACVGAFPESHVERVIGGLFAALNEKATGLEFSQERQDAMEQMWQMRARQFDTPFTKDREHFLDESADPTYWQQSITRFCQNVCEVESPPNIWAGGKGPSHEASQCVTAAIDRLVSAMREMNRLHFSRLS
ncbi:MAG: hypothetical protein OEV08_12390 [Nitrospira sp.]|nr:hypothetical protein [Nitrospira sp.]